MIYDFLYYCCYCATLKGKKHGSGEERASFLLSSIISGLVVTLYFFLVIEFNLHLPNNGVLVSSIIVFFIICNYSNDYYFVKTKRFIDIGNKYIDWPTRIKFMLGAFSLMLFFLVFILFATFGVALSNMLRVSH
jgi:hypothetical protein